MIRCIDVCKTYRQGDNDITALVGVSLDIAKGSFVAIMGPSGSGKSTLMHLIGGLDRPTRGDLLVDGRLIGQMPDDQVTLFRRYKIGFVFQFFNLLPTLTALENVVLPFVLVFMLLLSNDRELMGEHVNTRAYNIVAWVTAVVMIVLTIAMVLTQK